MFWSMYTVDREYDQFFKGKSSLIRNFTNIYGVRVKTSLGQNSKRDVQSVDFSNF